MTKVNVIFYKDSRGKAPVLSWLKNNKQKQELAKFRTRIELLKNHGIDLKRPMAAYLSEGIYELRLNSGNRHIRIFYFFHERKAVVLCHVIVKKSRKVPPKEIEIAVRRKERFVENPDLHTYVLNKE